MSYRFAPAAVCQTCYLTAAGYDQHELGYVADREPLHLLAGVCIPEGQVSDFGTLPCEGCGDHLAGERYAVSVDTHHLRPGATFGEVASGSLADPNYGRLNSVGEIFTNDSGDTFVGGFWGPDRTYASAPLQRTTTT